MHRHTPSCPVISTWREGESVLAPPLQIVFRNPGRKTWNNVEALLYPGRLWEPERVRGRFDGLVLEGSSHHHVAAAVKGQMVRPGERAVAFRAAERFDSCVLAEVSGELVGAGEAPGAALPSTVVRLLS